MLAYLLISGLFWEGRATARQRGYLNTKSAKAIDPTVVFVRNIPWNAKKTEIEKIFESYGNVEKIRIIRYASKKCPRKEEERKFSSKELGSRLRKPLRRNVSIMTRMSLLSLYACKTISTHRMFHISDDLTWDHYPANNNGIQLNNCL
ncbi:hypothetical protein NPIL_463111 [Nephila pilipes]|uniref:RRM domain-containing protein n=1 Tax=Nephila pilipes TaxID=299642 RepID=A0A8X6NNY1_NEPPI|nr:hypothetical protein NPIL_463111 [Nephila pilipes]